MKPYWLFAAALLCALQPAQAQNTTQDAPAALSAPPPAIEPPPSASETRALASSSATQDVQQSQAHDKALPIPEGALEVTATGTLEWLRGDQMYVARQNAQARHNGTVLKGDILVAHYQDPAPGPNGKKGSSQITLVTADGNPVEIIAPTAVAYGQHGTYDVAKHMMQLLGNNLKLVTTEEVITARDSLDYYEDQDTGVARGDAVMVREDGDKLSADTISAKFVHQAQKQKNEEKNGVPPATSQPPAPTVDANGDPVKPHALEHLDAKGHVVLVTQTDLVTGDEGTYNPITDIATVTGNVRVTRDQNQLDGARAEVDMATGISRVFAAPHEKVHALFVPKKKDANAKSDAKSNGGHPLQDTP